MTDAAEPRRAYEVDYVQKAAQITIDRVLHDIALRKWCVEQARGCELTHEEIYKFVTESAVEFLEDLGYIIPEAKPDTPS